MGFLAAHICSFASSNSQRAKQATTKIVVASRSTLKLRQEPLGQQAIHLKEPRNPTYLWWTVHSL